MFPFSLTLIIFAKEHFLILPQKQHTSTKYFKLTWQNQYNKDVEAMQEYGISVL